MKEKLHRFKIWLKNKAKAVKVAISNKVNGLLNWIRLNPETAIVIIPAVSAFLLKALKLIFGAFGKNARLAEERELKENYCYDRSLGHYWHLRRDLTNREWREVEARKEAGESLGEILESMKVLK